MCGTAALSQVQQPAGQPHNQVRLLSMQHEKEQETADCSIPGWFKMVWTVCITSWWFLLIRTLAIEPLSFFALSTTAFLVMSFGVVALSSPIMIILWLFPRSRTALCFYWLIRFLREIICVLSLLGLVYLYAIRASLTMLTGSVPFLTFVLLCAVGFFAESVRLDHFPLAGLENFFIPIKTLLSKLNAIPALVLGTVAAVMPILIVCSVIYFGLHARLSDYRPLSWNDEIGYWSWVRSFSQVGFNVGYNAPNELTAPLAFSHYGEGSPFYIYIYGFIAQLVGWSPELPLLINFSLLALVILCFIRFMNFDSVQIFFASLVTLLTWPILIFLGRTSHETLNHVIGFITAGIFYVLLTKERVRPTAKILYVCVFCFASLVRLSWGLLLIPLVYLCLSGSVLRRAVGSMFLGAGLFLGTIVLTGYLVPPVNNSIFFTFQQSIMLGPQVFIEQVLRQFKGMFRTGHLTPNIAVVFELLVILGWSLIRLGRFVRAQLPLASIIQTRTALDIYNVSTLLVAGLFFYMQSGFYRIFIPSILIILLLMIAQKDYKFLSALLMLQLFCFSPYVTYPGDYDDFRTNFTTDITTMERLKDTLGAFVSFDANTSNPWCNTILIPLDYFDYRVTLLPPGIGISYVVDSSPLKLGVVKFPLKSHYLLFDQQTYEKFSEALNVDLLASEEIGNLYRNLDSSCEIKR
jgi:hypothetical protein